MNNLMKIHLSDLAIFGGQPAFQHMLHVGRPNIGNQQELLERIQNILNRKWFTNDGPVVQELEKRIADFLDVKHCIAVCNATVGLEIAIKALELQGEVIVPSFTFVATAHALQWLGLTPVFCDIGSETLNLDPSAVEARIGPKTSAILGVHLWGRPCEPEIFETIVARHNLKLLFDAAHAFGCSHQGKMIGSFGDAEVFSFHATKFFNTFEGGAITTNDDSLAKQIRLMRNFGFAGYDNVATVGTNAKMNEISAAMGLTGLNSLDEFVNTNFQNYREYRVGLQGLTGVSLQRYEELERCNYQYVVLAIDEEIAGISRDTLMTVLHAENVFARRYFYPGCHQMEPYRTLYPDIANCLPVTNKATHTILCLPTGTSVTSKDIELICKLIHVAVKNASEINAKLCVS